MNTTLSTSDKLDKSDKLQSYMKAKEYFSNKIVSIILIFGFIFFAYNIMYSGMYLKCKHDFDFNNLDYLNNFNQKLDPNIIHKHCKCNYEQCFRNGRYHFILSFMPVGLVLLTIFSAALYENCEKFKKYDFELKRHVKAIIDYHKL